LLATPAGLALEQMATHTALGTRDEVASTIARFAELCGADELISVHPSPTVEGRLRSVEILASAVLG
jgi:alkanesulfonate monooxygenase SsuD/methylene tetrahydromethanopterin reductase-like flavin-dependent oxidoreductase (luciferase family)